MNVSLSSVEEKEPQLLDEDTKEDGDDEGDYLTTYILPSALVVLMILISLIIAFILSKRARRRKKDQEYSIVEIKEEKVIFGGVPVIFQDELEDNNRGSMRREGILKTSNPPPNYNNPATINAYRPPPRIKGHYSNSSRNIPPPIYNNQIRDKHVPP